MMTRPVPTLAAGQCEVIEVPNRLAAKVGPNFRNGAASSIAKAEKAMKELGSNFGEWLEDELVALEKVRASLKQDGLTTEVATQLSIRALDLKGLGATYEQPLVARIGASLFKMVDEVKAEQVPVGLIDAHVDAARAIVRNQIRDAAHPVGLALVGELETRVKELIAQQA